MTVSEGIFVVGGDGTIGNALASALIADEVGLVGALRPAARAGLYVTTRRRDSLAGQGRVFLDLADEESSWSLPANISLAFILAAQTNTATCRQNSLPTRLINVDKTVGLAERLVQQGARVIFLSSNQVFDGSIPGVAANARPCPRTEYGRQKALAEERLLALGDQVQIVRVTKVIDRDNKLLVQWASSLIAGQIIRPFADMVLAPVSLSFITEVLVALARLHIGLASSPVGPRIIQVSASRDITYEELARQLASQIGAMADLIEPARAADATVPFEWLPANTTLDTSTLEQVLGMAAPAPWDCVGDKNFSNYK